MKDKLKKIDWFQIGVFGLGIAATLAKSVYESKRFDADLDKRYEDHFDKKVEEIVKKQLKNIK